VITSVSVGTTATTILAGPSGSPYKFVAISNVGNETAYLKVVPGSAAVTVSNGIPLAPGAAFVCDQDAQREMFDAGASAIVGSGTTTISVQAF
jgi:hypothetical protein